MEQLTCYIDNCKIEACANVFMFGKRFMACFQHAAEAIRMGRNLQTEVTVEEIRKDLSGDVV